MKGLLSVSFGTSYVDTREKTIDAIDAKLAAAFPDRAFYSAWTSSIIMAKVLAERGEHHDSLDDAFARMTADGIDDLVVATTCFMQGHEMKRINKAAEEWMAKGARTLRVSTPLLASESDCRTVARAIIVEFATIPDEDAVLLMGHGSPYASNQSYEDIQKALRECGKSNYLVATVEGEPTFEDVLPQLDGLGATCIHLAPLMFVAGDHARNDLAGDDDDSWVNQLAARGFETEVVLKGLGEYPAIQQLAIDHALEAKEI